MKELLELKLNDMINGEARLLNQVLDRARKIQALNR
jgi:hypothetical protein